MISIKNLSVSFENKNILNNLNIEIEKGKTVVFFGKNGCGKSVFLKTIAGLIENYDGSVEINGFNLKKFYNINKFNKKQEKENFTLSYVFQKGGLFDSMNVFDNVAFPLRRQGINENELTDIVTNSIKKVGLSGNEKKLPSELSGGMQKRVGLARAICTNPDIILYDDPTAGLDPILSDSITDIIEEIKTVNRSTSLVVTHDIKVAERVADKVALLYKGEFVFSGQAHEFFKGDNLFARQFIEAKLEGPIDIF